jgi:hypothetical protein
MTYNVLGTLQHFVCLVKRDIKVAGIYGPKFGQTVVSRPRRNGTFILSLKAINVFVIYIYIYIYIYKGKLFTLVFGNGLPVVNVTRTRFREDVRVYTIPTPRVDRFK